MKDFLSKNWFKLMIGLSFMMFSFGFMVNSISPSYSNDKGIRDNKIAPTISTNGIEFEDGTLFVDKGTAYLYKGFRADEFERAGNWESFEIPK